ncbi:DNA cytosine methyltransferase [Ruficoccus amylovorans]|uniref:DNA (cytosine-5-)-methyltransferase n=1 Tax=Ruficoccus amylovorans TaxID=1804625 RepID=A0A842HH58_9BACT|nr:DNA cytosine methyltransferase [Ruficoccus amylovorans]MBC2594894.1 DNA cytosine methyltransferase [Ruficoccus amylovorans]
MESAKTSSYRNGQLPLDLHAELIVDNFAGGGGASTGIEMALGRSPDIAINHDPDALAMHRANHQEIRHLAEDVFAVDPVKVTQGRRVGLAWFSPDCKHHSKAKGGKPKDKRIRGLAWVVLHWIHRLGDNKPRIICLENVEEFQQWGPLDPDGKAKPELKGFTFRCFVGALQRRGYAVEWRELRGCDYGAPTIRKRLFLIARCDGQPIVWPEPTHGAPDSPEVKAKQLKSWRTAAECIDFSLPCPSIFERAKPLADATCRRIAKGIFRYVVDTKEPFIVSYYNQRGFRGQPADEPLRTQTCENRHAIVTPTLVNTANTKTTGRGPNNWPLTEPVRTLTSSPGFAVCAPVLTEHANASNERVFDPDAPLRTQCAEVKGGHFALVEAFLAKHYGGVVGSKCETPLGSVTAVDHHSLVSAHLTKFRTGAVGSECKDPVPTVTAGGDTARPAGNGHALGVVSANLVRHFGQSVGQGCDCPAPTVTSGGGGKTGVVTSQLAKLRGTNVGQDNREPLHTLSAQGTHFAEVRAFLVKYYGNEKDGVALNEPMHTVTAQDRFGLVQIHGEDYAIVDIGLRMLQPKELFAAQGFPKKYIFERGLYPALGGSFQWRPLTKTQQVRMCGNSVCPDLACAIVKANAPELSVKGVAA